jgi:hypothetical protein
VTNTVYVVVEGEIAHYFHYAPHGVFSRREVAEAYAAEVARANESVRWPNCAVIEFVVDQPGHINEWVLQ